MDAVTVNEMLCVGSRRSSESNVSVLSRLERHTTPTRTRLAGLRASGPFQVNPGRMNVTRTAPSALPATPCA